MADVPRAVFLSYASQDADVARRLTDALRAEGIEVWFDESELRGGDAWDAKIRRQISECALFVPVISAHSQDRREGYFRLEWRLADERSRLMAEGTPFVLPVVADGIKEREALVPKSFLDVQWTSLPHGDVPTAFVVRVQRLLAAEDGARKAEDGRQMIEDGGRKVAKVGRRVAAAAWTAGVVVVLGALQMVFWPRRPEAGAAPRPATAEAQPVDAKSIAVLPFANMCEDKDASAFFVDGMHEDVLTSLFLIRDLRVISRTSVGAYRDTKKPLKEVGRELGVAYILEGSVRRAGTKVRVTGQLIDARTDAHVWAKSYDRDLNDIFAIQSELAQAIATALEAVLSPDAKSLLARRSTTSIAAYELYVQARDIHRRGVNSPANLERAEAMVADAVAIDPAFAAAWAERASLNALIFGNFARSEIRLANAQAALEKTEQLAPDDPEAVRARGDFCHFALRDLDRAADAFDRLIDLQPNDADAWFSLGLVRRRQGRWLQAVTAMQRAVVLDPRNPRNLRNVAVLLNAGRRYAEAIALQERVVALSPGEWGDWSTLAGFRWHASGTIADTTSAPSAVPLSVQLREAFRAGDFEEVLRIDATLDGDEKAAAAFPAGASLLAQGRKAEARTRVAGEIDKMQTRLLSGPENAGLWLNLARLQSVAGRHQEALTSGQKAQALDPESVHDTHRRGVVLAWMRAWSGDVEGALADYAQLLRVPFGANVHELRHTPLPGALRDDPRWQALLDDPQNNAPLF